MEFGDQLLQTSFMALSKPSYYRARHLVVAKTRFIVVQNKCDAEMSLNCNKMSVLR